MYFLHMKTNKVTKATSVWHLPNHPSRTYNISSPQYHERYVSNLKETRCEKERWTSVA